MVVIKAPAAIPAQPVAAVDVEPVLAAPAPALAAGMGPPQHVAATIAPSPAIGPLLNPFVMWTSDKLVKQRLAKLAADRSAKAKTTRERRAADPEVAASDTAARKRRVADPVVAAKDKALLDKRHADTLRKAKGIIAKRTAYHRKKWGTGARPALPRYFPRDGFFSSFDKKEDVLPIRAAFCAMSGRVIFDDFRDALAKEGLSEDCEARLIAAINHDAMLLDSDVLRLADAYRSAMDPDAPLLECASCGIAEYGFDKLVYVTRTLAQCEDTLTSSHFRSKVVESEKKWPGLRTHFDHNGVSYALHPDLVRVQTLSDGVAELGDISFPLCPTCDQADGAGVLLSKCMSARVCRSCCCCFLCRRARLYHNWP